MSNNKHSCECSMKPSSELKIIIVWTVRSSEARFKVSKKGECK
jgi:hypothetical protein